MVLVVCMDSDWYNGVLSTPSFGTAKRHHSTLQLIESFILDARYVKYIVFSFCSCAHFCLLKNKKGRSGSVKGWKVKGVLNIVVDKWKGKEFGFGKEFEFTQLAMFPNPVLFSWDIHSCNQVC